MVKIKYEIWKNKKYVVARDTSGKFIQRRAVKGSKLTKKDFLNIFKQNNTFYKDKVRKKLTNVTENYVLKPVTKPRSWETKPIRKPRSQMAQYVVSGVIRNKTIYGRSRRLKFREDFPQTTRECKVEAWDNFLKLVSNEYSNELYSADEGIKLIENNRLDNIKEGWVYYT